MVRQCLRIFVIAVLAAGVPLAARGQTTPTPSPVAAVDPADPFLDGSVLHDIFLTINSRDCVSQK